MKIAFTLVQLAIGQASVGWGVSKKFSKINKIKNSYCRHFKQSFQEEEEEEVKG